MQFHQVPGVLGDLEQCVANELVVLVQPEPAIYWKVQNKVPGLKFGPPSPTEPETLPRARSLCLCCVCRRLLMVSGSLRAGAEVEQVRMDLL